MASMPIPSEILGKFRVFLSTLKAENDSVVAALQVARQELQFLARRGRLTSWAQQKIINRWKATGEANRIEFVGPIKGPNGETILMDVRPSPGEVRLDNWTIPSCEEGAHWEPNVSILAFATLVARGNVPPANKVQTRLSSLGTASAHALCRRIQRGGGTMMQAVCDMQEILQWGRLAVETYPSHFIAPTQYGYWAGQMLHIMDDDAETVTWDACARTWISSDDILDPTLDEGLTRLRTMGPTAPTARELMRKLAARRTTTTRLQ